MLVAFLIQVRQGTPLIPLHAEDFGLAAAKRHKGACDDECLVPDSAHRVQSPIVVQLGEIFPPKDDLFLFLFSSSCSWGQLKTLLESLGILIATNDVQMVRASLHVVEAN